MPANNPLDKVTWNHLTEACPQMRRRFRTGAAVELTAWLEMMRARWHAQVREIHDATDPEMVRWVEGMRRILWDRIAACATLIESVPGRWRTMDWHAATDTVRTWIDQGTAETPDLTLIPDPAAPAAEGGTSGA